MNWTLVNFFTPDCDEFDIDKQFDLIEKLQENEDDILKYVDEFIYLLNNLYLENGVDAELELFMESLDRDLLVLKVIMTFEDMKRIETVYNWGKLLFDDTSIKYTLKHARKMGNKNVFISYMNELKEELSIYVDNEIVEKRIRNINNAIQVLS